MDVISVKRLLLKKSLHDAACELLGSFYESYVDETSVTKSLGFVDDFYSLLKAYETRPPKAEDHAIGAVPDSKHFEEKRASGKRDRPPKGGHEAAATSMTDEQKKQSEERSKVYWHQSDRLKPSSTGGKQLGGPKEGAEGVGRKIGSSSSSVRESQLEPEKEESKKETGAKKPVEQDSYKPDEDREGREIEVDVKREQKGRKISAEKKDPNELIDTPQHLMTEEQKKIAHRHLDEMRARNEEKRREGRKQVLASVSPEVRKKIIEGKRRLAEKRAEQKKRQSDQDKPWHEQFKERREGLTSGMGKRGHPLADL